VSVDLGLPYLYHCTNIPSKSALDDLFHESSDDGRDEGDFVMDNLTQIGTVIFAAASAVHELWRDVFGQSFSQTWTAPREVRRMVLEKAQGVLNASGRPDGHVTLLVREPLSDRLILELSTLNSLSRGGTAPPELYFRNIKENYDEENRCAYYELYDRLCSGVDERRSQTAQEHRGLTGWVAVTGHYLKINSERADVMLKEMPKVRPEVGQAIIWYGSPVWARRTSEYLAPDSQESKEWSKRFLAVPIRSVHDPSLTIGVLRYTCSLAGGELTEIDRIFLESVAALLSTIENLERVKTSTGRDTRRDLEISHLRSAGNLQRFLRFVAESTQSEIASLYVLLKINDQEILRLIDAYGIKDSVHRLRDEIRDYSVETRGLTWEILEDTQEGPHLRNSVLDSKEWRGLNNLAFYAKHLSRLGRPELEKELTGPSARDVLKSYKVKLMGIRLGSQERPVGVLKVEFPKSFDSTLHYAESDQKFLESCRPALTSELEKYRDFAGGRWFDSASEKDAADYFKLVSQIEALRLLTPKEVESIQKKVEEYLERHRAVLEHEAKLINLSRDSEDRSYVRSMKERVLSEASKAIGTTFGRRIVDLLFSLIS
jgi:hypothetical protein